MDVSGGTMGLNKIEIEDIIRCANQGLSYAETSKLLNVNRSSVRKFAIKHGIVFEGLRGRYFEDKDFIAKVIEMYDSGMMGRQISAKLAVCAGTVFDIIKLNHTPRTITENYNIKGRTIRSDAFSFVDSERLSAYFYGWLVTDGCISDNGSIEIGLQEQDRYLLEKFKEFLNCSTNISASKSTLKTTNKTYYSAKLSFRDKQIHKDLFDLGLRPRKSCKEKLPTFDWKYGPTAKDFWQGVIEGDGSICDFDYGGLVTLVGSEELLCGFREYCEDIIGVKSGARVFSSKSCREDFKTIRYNNKDALLISKHLYTDTVFKLERKYAKAVSLIGKETARIERKSSRLSYISKKYNKYEARTPSINGKNLYLGTFKTIEEAVNHRDEFIELYEFLLNNVTLK